MARAEDYAEDAQNDRREQGGVKFYGKAGGYEGQLHMRIAADNVERCGDRLELQSNVRHDAENGDDRDKCAKPLGFAVAGADEVGYGRDVVFFADTDDFAQEKPPGKSCQRRAEVDEEKIEACCRCFPYAAVKGPGCCIDRYRQ